MFFHVIHVVTRQDHKNTSRYSSHYIPVAPCLGEVDIIVSMFSTVCSEIFSENDFSVMASRGCIDLYTCPSTSEIHHTTSIYFYFYFFPLLFTFTL